MFARTSLRRCRPKRPMCPLLVVGSANRFHPQADAQLAIKSSTSQMPFWSTRCSACRSWKAPQIPDENSPTCCRIGRGATRPSHLATYDTADSPERMLAARNVRNVASRDVSNLAAGVLGIIAN